MKKLFNIFLALSTASVLIASPCLASDDRPSKEVGLNLSGAFIPSGFDSNTDAYIVINGFYPNGCYSWSHFVVKNIDTFNHNVWAYANVAQGICPMIVMPFNKEVDLGKLASGTHHIKIINGDGTFILKTMTVE